MSFFLQSPFRIFERSFLYEKQNTSQETQKYVYPVFDISDWKVNSNTQIYPFSKKESLLKSYSLNSNQIFGICTSSINDILLAKKYAHFIYIPGELCRQSDILQAATESGLPIAIEKGCFLSPNDMMRVLDKMSSADVALVECGSSFGYSNVVLDPRVLYLLQKSGRPFGVNLSDLLANDATQYAHKTSWLNNTEFISVFIKTASIFSPQFFVIKNHISISTQEVLKILLTINS